MYMYIHTHTHTHTNTHAAAFVCYTQPLAYAYPCIICARIHMHYTRSVGAHIHALYALTQPLIHPRIPCAHTRTLVLSKAAAALMSDVFDPTGIHEHFCVVLNRSLIPENTPVKRVVGEEDI